MNGVRSGGERAHRCRREARGQRRSEREAARRPAAAKDRSETSAGVRLDRGRLTDATHESQCIDAIRRALSRRHGERGLGLRSRG